MGDQDTDTGLIAKKFSAMDERATAGQLALEVMHDLRNPLEALGHLVFLTINAAAEAELVAKYMNFAQEQITVLNGIANQTLGFARLSHRKRAIDLAGVTEAALRIHQRTIEAKCIHLVKVLPPELKAEVHSTQLLQVMSNLIVNALDALPERGTLSLRLRKRQAGVDIIVADNGSGIPVQYRDRIFEPFYTTKEENGNGLGLALVKRIVEDHRGTVRMRTSTSLQHRGTAFKISLPR
jgi:signal transduction histidine kinase